MFACQHLMNHVTLQARRVFIALDRAGSKFVGLRTHLAADENNYQKLSIRLIIYKKSWTIPVNDNQQHIALARLHRTTLARERLDSLVQTRS